MKYKSTRDSKISIRSSEAIIKGIADDGGLFVPERIPQINFEIGQLKEFDYMLQLETDYEGLSPRYQFFIVL